MWYSYFPTMTLAGLTSFLPMEKSTTVPDHSPQACQRSLPSSTPRALTRVWRHHTQNTNTHTTQTPYMDNMPFLLFPRSPGGSSGENACHDLHRQVVDFLFKKQESQRSDCHRWVKKIPRACYPLALEYFISRS